MTASLSVPTRRTEVGPRAQRDRAAEWIETLHDRATALFERLDGGAKFREDRWLREGGGGGVTRVLTNGATFEKAGVNRSAVQGVLPPAAVSRLGGRMGADEECHFFATGLSIVVHPWHPRTPTVHLNVRYFELADSSGAVRDVWFGGGTDLTPTYPTPDDARAFHCALRAICDGHDASFYSRFKPWCDQYFRNTHRGSEARGVGGIFFDHLRPREDVGMMNADDLFAFVGDVGSSLERTYAPLIRARRDDPSTDDERALQLARRARYVEFNLLHDRGTLFGLQTGARVESVLMSLPPRAEWAYMGGETPSALSVALAAMLEPRDWASDFA